jgi:diacylglycerol kinase family enzyme
MRSAKRIVIVADHPFAAHLDGEARTYRPDDTGVAHVEIEVVEGAIDVIAS